jgi:hypothetical protein
MRSEDYLQKNKPAIHGAVLAVIFTFLSGCSLNWKTIGKVDMSKVVSLEEVWNNYDKYVGKVVTIGLDTVVNSGKAGIVLPSGERYTMADFHTIIQKQRKGTTDKDMISRYIANIGGFDSAKGDTIFNGDYEVGFIFNDEIPPMWPPWVKDTMPILRLQTFDSDWERLDKKPVKYLCGVLLGSSLMVSEIDWIPELDFLKMFLCIRKMGLMPLGYKFKKSPEIPLLKVE